MEWLQITGNSLAFTGSVIISADLLQSKEHASAQSRTYFNRNPFVAIRSTKSNLIAFLMIVTGFAITLAIDIASATFLNQADTIFIVIAIASLGYLVVILLYRANERSYRKIEAQHRLDIFRSSLENTRDKFSRIIGTHNEKELFPVYKAGDISKLRENLKVVDSEKNEAMAGVVRSISSARTAKNIVNLIDNYFEK